jgi:hypothetical protein
MDVTFTGRPTDIDLLAADAQFQFILNSDDYSSDSEKIAYFLSKCRGPALTWGARYLDTNPGLTSETYAAFLGNVKSSFGYDAKQAGAIARSQLSSLRHTGTVIEFIADFDDACGRADIHADEPKITMILDKLKPRYRQSIIDGGVIPEKYAAVRKRLLNISAMEGQAADIERIQGQKNRRGKNRRGNGTGAEGPRVKIEAKN